MSEFFKTLMPKNTWVCCLGVIAQQMHLRIVLVAIKECSQPCESHDRWHISKNYLKSRVVSVFWHDTWGTHG